MSKAIPGQCAHEACHCPVEQGQRYCSDHCAKQDAAGDGNAEGGCNCGHPPCQVDA